MHSSGAAPARIVVVGGGQAGVEAARALREHGFSGRIALVDPGPFPYDRPPLSKAFLLGEADLDTIRIMPESWFDDADIELRAGRSAVALRPGEGVVELDDGSAVAADAVLLTTGGDARTLPVPGGDHPGVQVLRTVEHAERLRVLLGPEVRVVVVGGGLIGAEVASSALKLGCEVAIIEPLTPPLENAVGPEIAAILHGHHDAAGITVVADVVAAIVDDGGRPVVTTRSGASLPGDVVVVGIGMSPPTELAAGAGLEVHGGVVVDDRHRTSNPAVYAAGDAARTRRPDGSLHGREHWQAARAGGAAAAAAMLGQPAPPAEPEWFWSDRHGVHVEAVGTMIGPLRLHRGDPAAGSYAVFTVDESGLMLGAAAIDDSRMIAAARRIIRSGVAPDPAKLVDPSVNPRKLLRF